jgi:hypothetical protein
LNIGGFLGRRQGLFTLAQLAQPVRQGIDGGGQIWLEGIGPGDGQLA